MIRKLLHPLHVILKPRRRLRQARQFPFWLAGKYVELRGNNFWAGGYRFSLGDLAIQTHLKGRQLLLGYEVHERAAIQQYLDRTLPVIEFGGGLGVVSCVTNKLLSQPQSHVVVEADPEEIVVIERNRQRLGCHFEVVHGALGYRGDTAILYRTRGRTASSTKRQKGEMIEVRTVTLRSLLDRVGSSPVTVICDVEGTEVDLVQHEADVLARHVKMLIVELHPYIVGHEAVDATLQRLAAAGFECLSYAPPREPGAQVGVFVNRRLPD